MRKTSSGRRSSPHVGEISIDNRERVVEWTESCGGSLRGDLFIRRSCSSENEVSPVSSQEDEY